LTASGVLPRDSELDLMLRRKERQFPGQVPSGPEEALVFIAQNPKPACSQHESAGWVVPAINPRRELPAVRTALGDDL